MFYYYNKRGQINQVNVFCNVTVNNFYFGNDYSGAEDKPKDEDIVSEPEEQGPEEQDEEKSEPANKNQQLLLCDNSSSPWYWAEAEEENINDIKEKYLPCKLDTLRLEQVFQYLKRYDRAYNLNKCGTYLEFELEKGATIDKKKLSRINSCRQRLCTYCAWRRSLRVYTNVRKCCDEIMKRDKGKKHDYQSRFILATLTTRNCTLENLSNEVNLQLKGFNRLNQYKAFKNAYKGFIRALEVVVDREPLITPEMYFRKKKCGKEWKYMKDYYDKLGLSIGDENPNYMRCNVHIHILLHTTYDIYQGENYITQEKLTELWQRACDLDYTPIVDIRSFKAKDRNTKGKELAEIAKYTVKPTDYLRSEYVSNRVKKGRFDEDFINDCRVVMFLDEALSGRRLLAYGGTFKNIHQKLKLDDEKMIDDLEAEKAEKDILRYYFSFRQKKYIRIVGQ